MSNSVRNEINYSLDNGKPIDYYFYDPDPGIVLNPPGTDKQVVEIQDAWPIADKISVNREGFEIKAFGGGFRDYDNDAAVKSVFYDQIIDVVKSYTGAKRVVLMELKYKERTGEIYVMRHDRQHKWYYFPRMKPDQALLLKTYDSKTDGRARFIGHTTFKDPGTPPNAVKRESIEIRTMAFF